ncbi:hypothetical protein BDY21DRAFT_364994 [Lineolata rhizophorae]|uniref:Uncharacterized protein n=1 Tax=Lineolata rhizophorae TaxID=578093 RepID=A0A6A6NXT7_9PEZI|nr:hypothetical protein BDY21DRAFT_364994 [Lineolata rhizophorae]
MAPPPLVLGTTPSTTVTTLLPTSSLLASVGERVFPSSGTTVQTASAGIPPADATSLSGTGAPTPSVMVTLPDGTVPKEPPPEQVNTDDTLPRPAELGNHGTSLSSDSADSSADNPLTNATLVAVLVLCILFLLGFFGFLVYFLFFFRDNRRNCCMWGLFPFPILGRTTSSEMLRSEKDCEDAATVVVVDEKCSREHKTPPTSEAGAVVVVGDSSNEDIKPPSTLERPPSTPTPNGHDDSAAQLLPNQSLLSQPVAGEPQQPSQAQGTIVAEVSPPKSPTPTPFATAAHLTQPLSATVPPPPQAFLWRSIRTQHGEQQQTQQAGKGEGQHGRDHNRDDAFPHPVYRHNLARPKALERMQLGAHRAAQHHRHNHGGWMHIGDGGGDGNPHSNSNSIGAAARDLTRSGTRMMQRASRKSQELVAEALARDPSHHGFSAGRKLSKKVRRAVMEHEGAGGRTDGFSRIETRGGGWPLEEGKDGNGDEGRVERENSGTSIGKAY